MKSLNTLTGSAKARLLHELFPQEIPQLLEDITNFCADFSENKEAYKKDWPSDFIAFDYWLSLSEETAGLLKKHGHSILKSSRVFSDQLYFTYTFLFVTDRMIKYAEKVSTNEKFKLMVQILFT